MDQLNRVLLTPLKKIPHPKGNLFHVMKQSDKGFEGFGEAYFTTVNIGMIKGWKKHTRMTLNLIVPAGEVEFVVYDEKEKSFMRIVLSEENYQRLTIPSGLWVAFRGLSNKLNLILNIASIEHDPEESENRSIEEIAYEWQ